jgi:predicted RNase H-like HicB family nuclease
MKKKIKKKKDNLIRVPCGLRHSATCTLLEFKEVLSIKHPDIYAYPAIFSTDGDGWEVSFPDLGNCYTAADTLEKAIVEARYVLEDVMYLREKELDEIPVPSKLEDIKSKEGEVIQLVVAEMPEVRWEHGQI